MNKYLNQFNPSVSRNWLLGLAGLMWTGVGVMLCGYAYTWLTSPAESGSLILGGLGLVISVFAYRLKFGELAQKNLDRIVGRPEKACLFSFLAWKGYAIIAVMVSGGILLRNSAIPKPYLAVAYAAIGGALFLASLIYYSHLYRAAFARKTA